MLQFAPADSAFFDSTLHLEPSSGIYVPELEQAALWTDSWIMVAAVALSLLAGIINIRRIVNITPSLLACFMRWKENVNLEYSLKLRTDRNKTAFICILPFCLVMTTSGIYNPSFLADETWEIKLLGALLSWIIYIVTLSLLSSFFKKKTFPKDYFNTASHCIYTYFILMNGIIFLSTGILSLTGVDEMVSNIVILGEMSLIFIVFVFAKFQIFSSFCGVFPTFLYLCALDLIPTGVLVASVTLT